MGVSVCGRVAAAAEVKGKASLASLHYLEIIIRVCTILRSSSESWILRSSFFPTFWLLDSKALVCTILRSPYSSAKMWRRINYLDDSVDNIFAKEHFEIWTSSSYIDKDISLAIALIKYVTVHTFALKKERKRFGHGRWIVNVKKTTS